MAPGVLQAPSRPGAHRPRGRMRSPAPGQGRARRLPGKTCCGKRKAPKLSPSNRSYRRRKDAPRGAAQILFTPATRSWLYSAPLGFTGKSFLSAPTPASSGFNKCSQHPCCSRETLWQKSALPVFLNPSRRVITVGARVAWDLFWVQGKGWEGRGERNLAMKWGL